MCRSIILLFSILLIGLKAYSQNPDPKDETTQTEKDSIKKIEFSRSLMNGYLPTRYFDFDLRYLIKFNQYEGLRTGIGGVTNENFSDRYKIQGYTVYGFRDHRFKYNIGGGFRITEKTNTWLHVSYTDDLQETGSSKFLTDKRFFQFFEPRLLNIDLFHKHITKAITLEHRISDKLLTESQIALSKIDPTYNYTFAVDDQLYNNYDLSLLKISIQWNPFNTFNDDETIAGYPEFAVQYTKSFNDIVKGDFSFSKLDLRTVYKLKHVNESSTELVLSAGLATGKTPITHLYHAYPNNVNKETILQRFSVAGINSFETMYFNEFFSDRFATLQLKHKLRPFKITKRLKPELVLISRYALGNMTNIERHQGIDFKTLDKGYSESGFEINNLLFGFGLSFAYRYGSYHLAEFEDNFAFKFTFNVKLD
jgi:hypothetical protein